MAEHDNLLHHHTPRRLKFYAIAAAGLFLFILAFGIISRLAAARQLASSTDAAAIPTVSLISPSIAAQGQTLVLPGTVKAFYEAPIYAQVSGYLQSWSADIGTPVKAGQQLGLIATPNLDQQLLQAQANLASAMANEQIAAKTAQRWDQLRVQSVVSQQDADQKDADAQTTHAATMAARATLAGLQAQEAFKRLVAPFAGIVTARNTDIGALISTGAPGQTPLFVVDDESRLRLYVNVPQSYAAQLRATRNASFTVPEYPGRVFQAALVATADSISASSGTLLVQFQTDNSSLALQPGDYAQVTITLPAAAQGLSLPSSALMFRDSGMAVAVLGPDNRVIIKQVTIGRDLGNVVQIASGISATDRIINNPPDALAPGDQVTPGPGD